MFVNQGPFWALSKNSLAAVCWLPVRTTSHSSLTSRSMVLRYTLALLCLYWFPSFFSAVKVIQ
jgi:hypothetical protein